MHPIEMAKRCVIVAVVLLAGLNLGCGVLTLHYYTFSSAHLTNGAENRDRTELKTSCGIGVEDENLRLWVYSRNYIYVGSRQKMYPGPKSNLQPGSSPVPEMLRILIGLRTFESPLSFDPSKVRYLVPEQRTVEPAFVRGPEEPCRWASRHRYQIFREVGGEYLGGAFTFERTACFEVFFEVNAAPEQEFDLILGGLAKAGEPISPVRLHFSAGGVIGVVMRPKNMSTPVLGP